MLQLVCECGRKFQVDESHAGKRGRCRFCGRELEIPVSSAPDTVPRENLNEQTYSTVGARVKLADSLRSQQTLGQFVVLRKLGEGAMGEVWLARDERLGREVAIKVLPDDLRRDPERLQRFQREAMLMAKLLHPHAVAVHHLGEDHDLLYLVMEYVSGGSLADRVDASGPLDWRDATRAIRDAASGLAEAHRLGLVHRDIKPANLLRTIEGATKVGDFGLARPAAQDTRLTLQGGMLGTPSYMAPEQWEGQPADARSDPYALICSYYYLLTGQPAFDADNWLALGLQHRTKPFPDPRALKLTIPPSVVNILKVGSEKDPAKRIQTADELIEKLSAVLVLTSRPTSAQPSQRFPQRFAKAKPRSRRSWIRRNPSVAWIATGGCAVLMSLGFAFFVRTPLGTSDIAQILTGSVKTVEPVVNEERSANADLNPETEWLRNAGCEQALADGRIPEWTVVRGDWKPQRETPHHNPRTGSACFHAGESPIAELLQDVDIRKMAANVDSNAVHFEFSCFMHTLDQNPPDSCRVIVEFRDTKNQGVLTELDTNEQRSVNSWSPLNLSGEIPRGSGWIRVQLISRRYGNATRINDAKFDDLSLRLTSK